MELAAGAAMGTRKRQFASLFVVQVDVRIHTSERTGYLVHHLIHELVEVKDRADFLSGLLYFEKILDLIQIQQAGGRGKWCSEIWTGCHGSTPDESLITTDDRFDG